MRIMLIFIVATASVALAEDPDVRFEQRDGELRITIAETEVARYVYRDPMISRPYFAPLRTLSGLQVTRNHPPRQGEDPVDHADMHPGLWMSFGELSGHDYWRLKADTQHVRFTEEPSGKPGEGSFAVRNQYLTTDGRNTVCEETCRYAIRLVPQGYRIEIRSEFSPVESSIVFGDQEEMGLGLRVASSLAVDRKQGGRILDNENRRDGAAVWGKTAEWCDYSGPLNGKWAGVTVMSGPRNFHPSWSHARDYGLIVLNPFGRNAFTKEDKSRVEVKRGETLTLRFAAVVHESDSEADYSPAKAFQTFDAP